jgi:hypothetical protein
MNVKNKHLKKNICVPLYIKWSFVAAKMGHVTSLVLTQTRISYLGLVVPTLERRIVPEELHASREVGDGRMSSMKCQSLTTQEAASTSRSIQNSIQSIPPDWVVMKGSDPQAVFAT